jgi:hypothetical protein
MSHRYLLALARWALFSLLASGTVNATVYKICNQGKIEVRYATALRQGGFLSGYSWDVEGWYPIAPGECDDAYHQSNKRTGEPIYVAVAFTDSTGVWGAATFQGEDVDAKLCLKSDVVEYHLNGDVDQPCKSGFSKFPAALYLEPRERGCVDEIGVVCLAPYPYKFTFALDANSRAIAVNKGSGSAPASSDSATASSGPSMGTALGVLGALVVGAAILADARTPPKPFESGTLNAVFLGDKIVRRSTGDGKWYYENGSPIPDLYQLEGHTSSYLMDAPVQRSISDPEVVRAKNAIQQGLGDWSRDGHIELLPVGRLYYSYIKDEQHDLHRQTVTLASLDFTRASQEHDASGNTVLRIPCKKSEPCNIAKDEDNAGHFSNEKIHSDFVLLFTGSQNGNTIWNGLLRLRDLYPTEPAVVAR